MSFLPRPVISDIGYLVVHGTGVSVRVYGFHPGDPGVDGGVDPDPQGHVAAVGLVVGLEDGGVVVNILDDDLQLDLVKVLENKTLSSVKSLHFYFNLQSHI